MNKTKEGNWVDMSSVPMTDSGRYKWDDAIGMQLPFCYNDISGVIEIVGRKNQQYMYINIPGYVENFPIYNGQIKHCQLAGALQLIDHNYKYKVGDFINGIIITGITKSKYGYARQYSFQCPIDGYCGTIREEHIMRGLGCPVCSNHQVLQGINDIATTRPDLIKYFVHQEDAYKYAQWSNKRIDLICPECGYMKNGCISNLSHMGFCCPICGSGKSFPERFVNAVIKQVIEDKYIKLEKVFEWSKNVFSNNESLSGKKIYDFYICKDVEIIIEVNGMQHYKETTFTSRSLEEEQENDNLKKTIALNNGFTEDTYVVLDCRYSEVDYIKKSIMNSSLPKLLGFSEGDINWDEAAKCEDLNIIYIAAKFWNEETHNISEIAKKMSIQETTAKKHIRKAARLGLCDYPIKDWGPYTSRNIVVV